MLDYENDYCIKGIKELQDTFSNDYCNLTLIIDDATGYNECKNNCGFRKWCNSCVRLLK